MNRHIKLKWVFKAFFISLAISAVFSQGKPSWAKSPSKGKGGEADRPRLFGEIQTGLEYDSNIFQDNIQEESDMVWVSSLTLNYRPDLVRWSTLAAHNSYLGNSELSYSFFEVGADRPFGKKDYGSFFVQISPSAPLDKDESIGPPVTLGSYGFSAIYDRDLTRTWNSGLSFSYDQLNYNATFAAKDTKLFKVGFPQFIRPDRTWRFLVDLSLESGQARGGRVPSSTAPGGFRQDDISYRADVFSLQASYPVSHLSRLRVRYRVRRKIYTTNNTNDLFHFNRKDTNHQFLVGLRHRSSPKVTLRFRLKYLWRESTDRFVEFDEVLLSFSAAYRF
ncbi:MAG: hypothetical protein ACE5FZ_04290 [Nitrospiria bacterium]